MSLKTRTTKSILYRVYSFAITWLVMFLLTGSVEKAGINTVIIELVKTLNYFLFDYVWDKIKKGKEQ